MARAGTITRFFIDLIQFLFCLYIYKPLRFALIQAGKPRVDVLNVIWVLCTRLEHLVENRCVRHKDAIRGTLILRIVCLFRINFIGVVKRAEPVEALICSAVDWCSHPNHLESFNFVMLVHRNRRKQISTRELLV